MLNAAPNTQHCTAVLSGQALKEAQKKLLKIFLNERTLRADMLHSFSLRIFALYPSSSFLSQSTDSVCHFHMRTGNCNTLRQHSTQKRVKRSKTQAQDKKLAEQPRTVDQGHNINRKEFYFSQFPTA